MSTPLQHSSSVVPSSTVPLAVAESVVSDATQAVSTQLASSPTSTLQATPASQPVSGVPREHSAETPTPSEVPPEPIIRAPTPTSSRGGGGDHALASGRDVRGPRSHPILPEAIHPRRRTHFPPGDLYRRSISYPNSETAWNAPSEREPPREKTVGQRLAPTSAIAAEELARATKKAIFTGWAQNIALGLQVLVGALTTALGAALSGKNTAVAISILGATSTLITSYLARTKGSNEPQTSLLRAQALEHFLREIEGFILDHGHEVGDKWDYKIKGFRLGLEKILGSHPGSVTISPDTNPGQKMAVGSVDPGARYTESGDDAARSAKTGVATV